MAFSRVASRGTSGTTAYAVLYLLTPQTWAPITTGRSAGQRIGEISGLKPIVIAVKRGEAVLPLEIPANDE